MEKELEHMLNSDIILHHFYLIEGESELLIPRIYTSLEKRGISIQQNPLLTTEHFETFLVGDADSLRANAAEKKGEEPRISIIAFKAITTESAQTLLKVLEEPTPNTHFFFIVPLLEGILPTLRSRATIIKREQGSGEIDKEIKSFLSASPSKRFVIIAKIIEAHKNDDTSGGLRHAALQFLNGLENALSQNKKKDGAFAKSYSDILIARKYFSDRSASVKMILEHVALTI